MNKLNTIYFCKLCNAEELCHVTRGALGFSVLQIWPIGSVFRFSHLKSAVFRFWCLVRKPEPDDNFRTYKMNDSPSTGRFIVSLNFDNK